MEKLGIYIGYTLDYQECLLQEEEMYYLDLYTGEKYSKKEIFCQLLEPVYFISDPGDELTKRAKEIYEKDRLRKLDTSRLFIGNVWRKRDSSTFVIKKKSALLEQNDECYIDLENNAKYMGMDQISIQFLVERMVPYLEFLKYAEKISHVTYDICQEKTKKKTLEEYHKILNHGNLLR